MQQQASAQRALTRPYRLRTFAHVIIGGFVLSSAMMYMALKMGIVPGFSIVAAIIAFGVWRVLLRRDDFGTHENNLMQTGQTAATSAGFMCVVVAAYELLNIHVSAWSVFWWIGSACTLGVFLAIPMREQFIVKEKLKFADGQAAAAAITSLDDPHGPGERQANTLFAGGLFSAAFGVFRDYYGLIPTEWLIRAKYYVGLEFSVMLVGSGILVGLRVCLWMAVGSLLTWLVLAPVLVSSGIALEVAQVFNKMPAYEAEKFFPVLMNWTMWPATVLLVVGGLTALLLRWRMLLDSFVSLAQLAKSAGRSEHAGVSFKLGVAGCIAAFALMATVQSLAFGTSVWMTLLSFPVLLVLLVVGIRAAGETNIGPVSVMGSMTQLFFALFSPGNIAVNMATSGAVASASSQGQDLMFDLKTGHVLKAEPRYMIVYQLVGVWVGALAVALVYPLLSSRYGLGEGLPAPTAFKWKGFAELLTKGVSVLPTSAVIAIVVATVAGIVLSVMEKRLGDKAAEDEEGKEHLWVPSTMGLAIGMLLPSMTVMIIAVGGVLGWMWKRKSAVSSDEYAMPLASGLIAGEALMAVLIPVLVTVLSMLTGVP